MAIKSNLYLDLYQTPVMGTAIAIFNNGISRPSLEMLLNNTSFFMVGNKALMAYNRSMQGKKATNTFTRDFYPEQIGEIVRRIENGIAPNETLELISSIDASYDPKRSRFSIVKSSKEEKENPKETLKRIFSVYPVLLIPRESKNLNDPKIKDLNSLLLYDISEESLRSGYENGVFKEKENGEMKTILLRKKEGLLNLYALHGNNLATALRTTNLKVVGDPSMELMKRIAKMEEMYNSLVEKYEKVCGQVLEIESERNSMVDANAELFNRFKEAQKLYEDAKLGRIDADLAESQMKELRERMFEPLGGKRTKKIETEGGSLEIEYIGGLGEISTGEGKDKKAIV